MLVDLAFIGFLIMLFPGIIGMTVLLAYKHLTASDKRANSRNMQLLDNERENIMNRRLELEISKSAVELEISKRLQLEAGKAPNVEILDRARKMYGGNAD